VCQFRIVNTAYLLEISLYVSSVVRGGWPCMPSSALPSKSFAAESTSSMVYRLPPYDLLSLPRGSGVLYSARRPSVSHGFVPGGSPAQWNSMVELGPSAVAMSSHATAARELPGRGWQGR